MNPSTFYQNTFLYLFDNIGTGDDSDGGKKENDGYEKRQLTKHNMYRATHQSPFMSLDDRLNKEAKAHATKLAAKGKSLSLSDHDENTDDGENIGQRCSSSSYPPYDEVTDQW